MTQPLMYAGFPTVVDNTMRSAWVKCHQYFFRQCLQGWQKEGNNDHLHFGAAYAHGLEVIRTEFYANHKSAEDSTIAGIAAAISAYGWYEPQMPSPSAQKKNWRGLVNMLLAYVNKFPLGKEAYAPVLFGDKLAVEFNFTLPLPVMHPATGEPILYTGRFDMVCQNTHSQVFGADDKTTSALGQQWANQWALDSQMTGYCWGAQEMGFPVIGMLIRGNCLYAAGNAELQEHVTYRQAWQIEQWLSNITRELEEIKIIWSKWSSNYHDSLSNPVPEYDGAEHWKYALGKPCSEFGGCSFTDICLSEDPHRWLPVNFVRRYWNPIERKLVHPGEV